MFGKRTSTSDANSNPHTSHRPLYAALLNSITTVSDSSSTLIVPGENS